MGVRVTETRGRHRPLLSGQPPVKQCRSGNFPDPASHTAHPCGEPGSAAAAHPEPDQGGTTSVRYGACPATSAVWLCTLAASPTRPLRVLITPNACRNQPRASSWPVRGRMIVPMVRRSSALTGRLRRSRNVGFARSRRQWLIQRYRVGLHWYERAPRFARAAAVSRSVADPDCHEVPAMAPGAGNGGLVNDNSVQQWLGGVRVRSSEQESAVVAEQPGVQGLHAAEVRNLDEFRMPRLRMHKAAPQGQSTTVLAGPQTIALL